jgi:hypothetical protein
MAGFRRPTLTPEFTGDYAGFTMTARRMSMEQLLTLSEMAVLDMDDQDGVRRIWKRVCDTLAELIIEWNLLDEGDDGPFPVEITSEVIRELDWHFVVTICDALGKTAKADSDLGKGSTSGVSSQEASLTMVPVSQSQAS